MFDYGQKSELLRQKNENIGNSIDGIEIGSEPARIPAGNHEIVMTKAEGTVIRKYVEFTDGN